MDRFHDVEPNSFIHSAQIIVCRVLFWAPETHIRRDGQKIPVLRECALQLGETMNKHSTRYLPRSEGPRRNKAGKQIGSVRATASADGTARGTLLRG